MKYTKVYMIGGKAGKSDPTDYIDYYEAENGMIINIQEPINSSERTYTVNGNVFCTLKEAKRYVERKGK